MDKSYFQQRWRSSNVELLITYAEFEICPRETVVSSTLQLTTKSHIKCARYCNKEMQPMINGIINCKLERMKEKKHGEDSQEQVDSVATYIHCGKHRMLTKPKRLLCIPSFLKYLDRDHVKRSNSPCVVPPLSSSCFVHCSLIHRFQFKRHGGTVCQVVYEDIRYIKRKQNAVSRSKTVLNRVIDKLSNVIKFRRNKESKL